MAEFRCIGASLLFSLMTLQLTAAVPGNCHGFGREGGEVSLPCGVMKHDHDDCNTTTWVFSDSAHAAAVTLFEFGKIHKHAKNKSDRLSVTADCSLAIKKLAAEDVGHYTCRKYNKSNKQEATADFCLVKMTEQKHDGTVTLTCSVGKLNGCPSTVNWLYGDNDNNNKDLMTSQTTCSANVTFATSHYVYTSKNYELFKCRVMNDDGGQEFTFKVRPPGMKTGWRKFIVVAAVLSALLITAVTFVIRRRSKRNKTPMSENKEVNLNPAVPQPAPTDINLADPGDTVCYTLISFTRKSRSKAKVLGKQYEPVIYSTVKAASSS